MAKISLDLARSGRISTVFQNFLIGFCRFSYFLGRIPAVFQIINLDRDPTTFQQELSDPIWFSDWSTAGLKIWNPTWSGRSRVGHKPDPDRPVVTLIYYNEKNHHNNIKVIAIVDVGCCNKIWGNKFMQQKILM